MAEANAPAIAACPDCGVSSIVRHSSYSLIIFPSVDAIEEFKVQTSTYSAEFGRANGGVLNLQIKSGMNQFHGSGFEFLRNDKFDANNLFNNKFGKLIRITRSR